MRKSFNGLYALAKGPFGSDVLQVKELQK